jgi:hypothetical protein
MIVSGNGGCGSRKARASASLSLSLSCVFRCCEYREYCTGQQRSDSQRSSTLTVQPSVLERAETEYGRTVVLVSLRVSHQLQRYCPWPRHGDETEPTLAEDRQGRGVLVLCRIVKDGVVPLLLLAVCVACQVSLHIGRETWTVTMIGRTREPRGAQCLRGRSSNHH